MRGWGQLTVVVTVNFGADFLFLTTFCLGIRVIELREFNEKNMDKIGKFLKSFDIQLNFNMYWAIKLLQVESFQMYGENTNTMAIR